MKSAHKSLQCRFKNKLKSEWITNNAQPTQRGQEVLNKGNNNTAETEETSNYSGNSTTTSKSKFKTNWMDKFTL